MARRRSANLNEPSQVPALPNSNHSRRREKDGKPGPRPSLTCLDLFCGCGGFSLGMERAGFRTLAAVDVIVGGPPCQGFSNA